MTTRYSRRTILALGASSLAVSACSNAPIAGSFIDEGGFGNPTMNNMMVQTGQIKAVTDLSSTFAASVPTTVNFAFNSSRLDGAAQNTLRKQADFMRQFPEVRFSVYGHTDKVGGDSANRRLGERRARAVVNYLASLGVSRSRLEALVSYGESQPLVANPGRERANRRTVTEVSGFVEDHPLVLDGKYAQVVYRRYVSGAGSSAAAGAGSGT